MNYEITIGDNNYTLSSSTSSLQGGGGFDVPRQTVQLEGKGQGIVANELIWEGQWIWMSQEGLVIGRTFIPMIPLIYYSRSGVRRHSVGIGTGDCTMVWGGSPDICKILDDGSYYNGNYGVSVNIRVDAETGCTAKDYKFHFLADGDIVVDEEII